MNRESRKYTPTEFVEKLKGDVDHTQPHAFVGMLKAAEDEQHLLFAPGASCANWTPVPVSLIESIELISEMPCKDHSHPLVKMTFKAPASEEAQMYASLAQASLFVGSPAHAMAPRIRHFREGKRDVLFQNSGPDVWFPCWSHCMDDLLEFASEQPADQWKFWTSLAYQLCSQICP